MRTTEPSRPICTCCNGTGQHGHRPYLTASPYDDDCECSTCEGRGTSWFEARPQSCRAYRDMMKGFR